MSHYTAQGKTRHFESQIRSASHAPRCYTAFYVIHPEYYSLLVMHNDE